MRRDTTKNFGTPLSRGRKTYWNWLCFRNRLSWSFRDHSFAFRGHTLFAQRFRGTFRERSLNIDCGHICTINMSFKMSFRICLSLPCVCDVFRNSFLKAFAT